VATSLATTWRQGPALESGGEHCDPFDRLLVCQSRVEPMLLLSLDRQIERYGSTVIVI
jgi:PIN domain nuclease of toxin-antitoxin system